MACCAIGRPAQIGLDSKYWQAAQWQAARSAVCSCPPCYRPNANSGLHDQLRTTATTQSPHVGSRLEPTAGCPEWPLGFHHGPPPPLASAQEDYIALRTAELLGVDLRAV